MPANIYQGRDKVPKYRYNDLLNALSTLGKEFSASYNFLVFGANYLKPICQRK